MGRAARARVLGANECFVFEEVPPRQLEPVSEIREVERSLRAAHRENATISNRDARSARAARAARSIHASIRANRNPSVNTNQEAPSMTRTRTEYRPSPVTTEPPSIERVTREWSGPIVTNSRE